MKRLLLLTLFPLALTAHPAHQASLTVYEKLLSSCVDVQPFDAAKIYREAHGPGRQDVFHYTLRYRIVKQTLILGYNPWKELVYEKTIETRITHSEPFTISETLGGPHQLKTEVQRRLDDLTYDACVK